MQPSRSFRRAAVSVLALAMALSLTLPASAFFWNTKKEASAPQDFSKNGMIGSVISFTPEEFGVTENSADPLVQITLDVLPDSGAGVLCMGSEPLEAGCAVDVSALNGLRFQSAQAPTLTTTSFAFTPTFASGQQGGQVTVTLYLLEQENQPPVARNMELSTYRDVAITGYFDAVDGEGDTLTFQLTSTPARGAVTLAEDGSSQFVYTPYENKTGSDHFTYVAIDSAGNTSPEATVKLHIDKPDTTVTYADMEGNSAHKAAIRLAEEEIYVGRYVDGNYFFDPDRPVTRAQFLSMAMSVTGLEELEGVTLTGFSDDAAIPTWAKGSVSAALKAGAIQGTRDETGAPVFGADQNITRGEASVMLNNLLDITDVPLEVFSSTGTEGHWAAQAAANLSASGVTDPQSTTASQLSDQLTLAQAAEMLDGALEMMDSRESGWLIF